MLTFDHLRRAILCLAFTFTGGSAFAVAYSFPGNLPSGCSGSAGSYTCGAVSLWDADTVTIGSPKPATINATSFNTHGAQINAAGSVSELSIVVSGVFESSSGATINANVTAGYVSSPGHVNYGGSLTATSTYVSLGGHATVGGSISAKTYVDTGSYSAITGSISSETSYIDTGHHTSVGGDLTAGGTYIDIHGDTTVGGSMTAASYINIVGNSAVTGGVTAKTVYVYSGASVAQCARATTGLLYNNTGSSIAGACCGSGSTCTNTCVQTSPKPPACQTLHHLELTTLSNTATANSSVTYTVKACGNAACSTLYTTGVTGTLAISGVTPTYPSGAAFSISAGSSTATVIAQMTAGTATASVPSSSPTPTNTPRVFCGMGVAAGSGNSCDLTVTPAVHHLEVTTPSASGLTCAPTDFTIKACADAATPCMPYTSGVTGNLVLTGTGGSTAAFTINSGSSTATVSRQITKVGTVVASITSPTPVPSNTPATFCGMGAAATSGGSCSFSTATSALRITNLSNHVANVLQTGVQLQAVKSTSDNTACVPAFTGAKTISFSCAYSNPTSGSRPVVVGASASAACGNNTGGVSQALALTFDGTGTASTTVQYGDVGQVRLTASYAGTAGVDADVTGFVDFIATPASFGLTGLPSGTITAGAAFGVTITALVSGGGTALNFGKETPSTADYVRLSFAKATPVSGVAGTFSGTGTASTPTLSSSSFSAGSGSASISNLKWDEVGTGSLTAALAGGTYLGVSTSAVGTASLGPFIPSYLDVTRGSYGHSCGVFAYSGQPFNVVVTARNQSGGTTQNYANQVDLTANSNGTTGTLANGTIAASSFVLGASANAAATSSSPRFTFNSKVTTPTAVSFTATDHTYSAVNSVGHTEEAISLRSGRIKVSNAFGSEKAGLSIPVQTQFWSGKAWVLNSADSCTSIPAASVVRAGYLDYKGAATTAWSTTPSAVTISGGNGTLSLSAPSPSSTGSVDFAFNLGATATDQSCLSAHPNSTGANLSWLRARNGTGNDCNGVSTDDRDPSARATFGVYQPESNKAVYVRDMY